MTRSKYTKLTWTADSQSGVDSAVTPSGVVLTRVTFGVGMGLSVTGITWQGRGNPVDNYWDRINGCRSTYRNLVEVDGGARRDAPRPAYVAERTVYKMYPELWLTPEAYQQWVCEGQPEEDPWAVSQGYL